MVEKPRSLGLVAQGKESGVKMTETCGAVVAAVAQLYKAASGGMQGCSCVCVFWSDAFVNLGFGMVGHWWSMDSCLKSS